MNVAQGNLPHKVFLLIFTEFFLPRVSLLHRVFLLPKMPPSLRVLFRILCKVTHHKFLVYKSRLKVWLMLILLQKPFSKLGSNQ